MVDDHVSVDAVPAVIEAGLADKLAVGVAVVLVIETATDFVMEREPPTQVNVKVLGAVMAKVCWPFVGLAPVHSPEAVHEVAREDVQLSTVELPCATLVGEAERDRVIGAAKAAGATRASAVSTIVRKK